MTEPLDLEPDFELDLEPVAIDLTADFELDLEPVPINLDCLEYQPDNTGGENEPI